MPLVFPRLCPARWPVIVTHSASHFAITQLEERGGELRALDALTKAIESKDSSSGDPSVEQLTAAIFLVGGCRYTFLLFPASVFCVHGCVCPGVMRFGTSLASTRLSSHLLVCRGDGIGQA
jgi:hypothetical protein